MPSSTSSSFSSLESLPPLLVLLGPTAVGKTDLSLQLAHTFHAEIISADSRLFYRGLDIGTAKPSPAEQAAVPHHLIDLCDPDETLTLGAYQRLVYTTIQAIHGRGHLPLLVGGTGQYLWAILEGWHIPELPPQPRLRAYLEQLPPAELARWVRHLDPVKAETLDLHNPRRTIRALELLLSTGQRLSQRPQKQAPPYDSLIIGLHRDRAELYARIDQRVAEMIAAGLEEEVRRLVAAGYDWQLPALSGLGYRQFAPYFAGEQSLAEVIERIQFETHQFVRRQANWFKQNDPRIHWLPAAAPDLREQAVALIQEWRPDLIRQGHGSPGAEER